jgi:hypothetical protein
VKLKLGLKPLLFLGVYSPGDTLHTWLWRVKLISDSWKL